MNRYRIFLLSLIVLLFIGCTKVGFAKYPKEYKPSNRAYGLPKLGVISTVEIGENMFSKVFSKGKTIHPLGNAVQVDKKIFNFKNNALRITEEGYNSLCYSWFCAVDTKNDGFLDSWWNARGEKVYLPLDEKISYKLEDIKTLGYFHETCLYQGKVGNKLKVSYREFKDNLARAAFTQDVEYEINSSGHTIIGFRGLRIEVIKATNLDITYTVLSPFD